MDKTNTEETDESTLPESETDWESETGWAELTYDCLTNIIARLSLEHRWRAMLVCKPWLLACKDPHLNSCFVLVPNSEVEPELTPELGRKVDSILRSVAEWSEGSLREIRTRNCSDASLSFVAERCPNLEVLSIKYSPKVTDASMAGIALGCPMIKELDISHCYGISHESLVLIGRSCPNLTILRRNGLGVVGLMVKEGYENLEADAIGKSMPNQKHLELRSTDVTAEGLGSISAGCRKLEYLDLRGCRNSTRFDIDDAMSELQNLKEIKNPPFYVPLSPLY